MDNRRVVWDTFNRRHIQDDHPERAISTKEVEEALNNPIGAEVAEMREGQVYHPVLGRTSAGRLLFIVYVDESRGRYPVHARVAGRRTRRRYQQ